MAAAVGSHGACSSCASLLVLLLAATAATRVGAVTGPQLLVNPGMQAGTNPIQSVATITGSAPDSWFDNSDWAVPPPTLKYTLVTSSPRTTAGSRSWCVQVAAGAANFAQAGQGVYVKSGINYTLSVYARVSLAPTSTTKVTVGVGLQAGYDPWPSWGVGSLVLTKTSGWKQLVLPKLSSLPAPAPGYAVSSPVPAMFMLYVQTPGVTVCFDDASLVETVMCSGNPKAPANATFSCLLTSVGASCSANCTGGTQGNPTPTANCTSAGTWSSVSGQCTLPAASACRGALPAVPTNSLAWPATCNGTANGGLCSTNCSTGFSGVISTTCANGVWGAAVGSCSPTACRGALPAVPTNSLAWPATCNGTANGGLCSTNCSTGFSGVISTTCANGVWGAAVGSCSVTVAPTNVLENPGFEDGTVNLPSGGSITGTIAWWWVDNSDWATPQPTLVYSLATDSPHTAAGARSQCVQVVSGFAQFVQSMALHTYSNYTASVWLRVKAAATASTQISMQLALTQGFSPYSWLGSASASLTMNSGWTQLQVPSLPALTQADPANPGSTTSTLLVIRINTPGTMVCMDDASVLWQGGVSCTGSPANPANGAFACAAKTYVGETCTATCTAGFYGSPSAVCLPTGKWSGVNGTCSAVTCTGNPTQPSYGTFACAASTGVGGRCNATCNVAAGYIGEPAPYAVCTATGAWAATGQCVRPNLLLNAGFESGSRAFSYNGGNITATSMPDSWDDNSGWQSPAPVLTYTTPTDMPRTPVSNRTLCVTFTSGAGLVAQIAQARALNASTDYTLSAWFLVRAAASATTPVSVRLVLSTGFAPYTWLGNAPATLTMEGGWTQVSLPNLATLPSVNPANPAGGAPVLFLMLVETPGTTVCMDDARLSKTYDPQPELLTNAKFDGPTFTWSSASGSGVMAYGWGDNTDWVQPPVRIQSSVVTGTEARSGSALKLFILSGYIQFAQFLSVPSGNAYRLTIWARAAAPGLSITLSLRSGGEPYNAFGSATAVVGTAWTQLVVPVVVVPPGSGGASAAPISAMVNTGGTGTLWLDDASLTTVPSGQSLPSRVLDTPLTAPIDMSYFGFNFNHMFGGWFTNVYQYGYLYPSTDFLPFGLFRTWDLIVWPDIQPYNTTHFEWGNLDYVAAQASARGQKILFTLGQSPDWATSNLTLQSVYGPGRGSPPANVTHWTNFVRALERRYKGVVAAYEVWNEPNLQGPTGFYNGQPEQLSALALATQQVLQAEASTALLLTPAMAGLSADGLAFLNRYLTEAKRLGVVTQGIAWHSYNMPAEGDIESVATLRSLMASQGLAADLPVLNTEAGILDTVFASMGNDHKLGAAYLAKVYVLNWALGVSRLCWYAYDAATMEGLDMSTPTAQVADQLNVAGLAYKRVVGWLLGASISSMARTQGVWVASLSRVSGSTTTSSWVVWNGDARVTGQTLSIPAAWNVRYAEELLTGALTSLTPGVTSSVTVTNTPMLLRQA